MRQQPVFAYDGDLSSIPARRLRERLTLVSSGANGQTPLTGMIVHGAEVGVDFHFEAAKRMLASGALLAVIEPTAEHLRALQQVTGQAPPPDVALVTCRQAQEGAGYEWSTVPRGKFRERASAERGRIEAASVTSAADPVETLLATAHGESRPAASPAGLIPPAGSTCGYSSFSSSLPWSAGAPTINGAPDDSTAGNGTQQMNNQALTEFYVYWVNGGSSPYFVVILRQTGTIVAGASLAANIHSRGWFQFGFQLLQNSVKDTSDKPLTQGLALAAYSPVTSANPVPVQMAVPMTLYARGGGGMGPVQFNAQVADALSYPGWAILDQTSGMGTAWESYQAQGWNPVQNPPADFGTWYVSVYDQNDNVIQMPDLSSGSIFYEAVTAWQLSPPLFTPPPNSPFTPAPSLPLHFSGGWLQNVAFLHDPAGCRGAEGSNHHHLFSAAAEWTWAWYIDVGVVANWGNLQAMMTDRAAAVR